MEVRMLGIGLGMRIEGFVGGRISVAEVEELGDGERWESL